MQDRITDYSVTLERIKKSIKKSHDYFKPNYDRYNDFRKFVFESSLREEDITLLMTISKPQLEFNVLEAYISRLLGEFSKQMPDICVSADDENDADPQTIKFVEEHLRHVMSDHKNDNTRYDVYKDLLSGGFSVLKVTTDYANSMSFNQVININRVYEPTLCGFDQLARESHKGDGRFCFELFPMEKEDFEVTYPDIPIGDLDYNKSFAGFNWAYVNGNEKIVLVADFYEKVKKKVKIVQLVDGQVMRESDYKKLLKRWDYLAQPPAIKGKPRMTDVETVKRTRLIENRILEEVDTDYAYLPLIFVDGNSMLMKSHKNGNIQQVTRPYVYHAKDAQRMKNFAGISLMNEIENMVQHKFKVAKEALPKEDGWLAAYKDVQKASVLVYNAYYEEDPTKPVPPPQEVARVPAPPEVIQAFQATDSLMQMILGSYDASLGINDNQLSGIAVIEAASQSNAAAMPYIVGYMQGWSRAAQVYVDLMPKYYVTPRTMPAVDDRGRRYSMPINQKGSVNMFFDANKLNVTVKAGASFQVQKSRTLMMVKEMMGMSQLFAQFMTEKGLPFILDNMEGRSIEQLKGLVDEWLAEYQQQKDMAMKAQQQEMMNNPIAQKNALEKAKLEQKSAEHQGKMMLDMANLRKDMQKIVFDMQNAKDAHQVQLVKAQTERFAKQMDAYIKHMDIQSKHDIATKKHNENKH